MPKAITIPKLGLTMKKATVVKWHKKEGDQVEKDEIIAEIETDKVACQIQAPEKGTLLKIAAQRGSVLPVGGVMGYVGRAGEEIPETLTAAPSTVQQSAAIQAAKTSAPSAPSATEKRRVSPRARRLAEEKNVDMSQIAGTGPEGMVLESDVLSYIENRLSRTADGLKVREVIPFSATRKAIAENMTLSLQAMAQVTLMSDVDASNLVELQRKTSSSEPHATYTDLLVKIVAKTLENNPILNSTVEDEQIKTIEEINLGVAVAADSGLVVPVVRNANKRSLSEISANLRQLAERVREGKLSLEDVSGGTFTITNLGTYGVKSFTPIVNPPQTAILGVGEVALAPFVEAEKVVVKPIMTLSLTFDHRAMDGHLAATFLKDLRSNLESDQLEAYLG